MKNKMTFLAGVYSVTATFGLFSVLALGNLSFADGSNDQSTSSSTSGVDAAEHTVIKAAFESCSSELNLPTPTPGEHGQLDPSQRKQLFSCVKGLVPDFRPHFRHHKEMKACLETKGVTMPQFVPGQKPILDDDQEAALTACRAQIKAQHRKSS